MCVSCLNPRMIYYVPLDKEQHSAVARAGLWSQRSWAACRGLCACSTSPSPPLRAHRSLHSKPASPVHPRMAEYHLLLRMCSGTRGTRLELVGNTEFQAPSQTYWTRISIWQGSPVIPCVLKFVTHWFPKLWRKGHWKQIFPYNQESELLTTMVKTNKQKNPNCKGE